MTDQQLIEAAKQAGLCFPDCWNLERTDDDIAADARWIQEGHDQDPAIGHTRQQILETSQRQRSERLQQLRRFTELVKAL